MGFPFVPRGPGWAFLGALALVVSCGQIPRHKEKPATPRDERVELLLARLEGERLELAAASDPFTGWPSATDCDGLLWAGLAAAAGQSVDLELAEYSPGEMHRRPRPPCWDGEDKGSKSTISRDMLTGYLYATWRRKDGHAAQRLAEYGERHDWVMGGGDRSRTDMRANLKGLLGRMLAALTSDRPEYRFLPALYVPGGADYERHIAVLGVLLQGEVAGGIQHDMFLTLKGNAEDNPQDALFQAAYGVYTGDMGPALDLLLNPAYAPPKYVRGAEEVYKLVHFVFAADTVVRRFQI